MDPRFTLQQLLAELGPTQIQAMLWRLDHMGSAQTTADQEFDFVTGHQLPECPHDQRVTFLRKLKAEYIEQLRTGPTPPGKVRSNLQPAEQLSSST